MQKIPSYRSWAAGLLALLFVAAWSAKAMHGFFYHADYHDRPVCTVQRDHAAAHIHDTRYATDGCSLCAFVLSIPTLPSVITLSPFKAPPLAEARPIWYGSPVVRATVGTAPSRGPPVC